MSAINLKFDSYITIKGHKIQDNKGHNIILIHHVTILSLMVLRSKDHIAIY